MKKNHRILLTARRNNYVSLLLLIIAQRHIGALKNRLRTHKALNAP